MSPDSSNAELRRFFVTYVDEGIKATSYPRIVVHNSVDSAKSGDPDRELTTEEKLTSIPQTLAVKVRRQDYGMDRPQSGPLLDFGSWCVIEPKTGHQQRDERGNPVYDGKTRPRITALDLSLREAVIFVLHGFGNWVMDYQTLKGVLNYEDCEKAYSLPDEEVLRMMSGPSGFKIAALVKSAYIWVERWLDDDTVKATLEEAVEKLALLSREEYESGNRRKRAAKRLGIDKPKELDRLVYARREETEQKREEERVVAIFKDSTPFPEPVNGAELADKIAAVYRRFIVFKHAHDAEVASLWAFGTHLIEAFNVFARLGYTAPLHDSGKSTALDVTEHLVLKGVHADNVSSAVVFRIMAELHPTLLLDELDTFLAENPELVGILNSGHKKNGQVFRMEKIDEKQQLAGFETFGAVAYAMIGKPTGAFFSRTIFIQLERKGRDEQVEDFNLEENPTLADELTVLRRQLARWAADNVEAVKAMKPETGNLSNRTRDNWRALLKIAHVIGGDWPGKILAAAGVKPPRTRKGAQEKLLVDLRNIFHTRGVDRIPTVALLADLLMQEESGWRRYYRDHDPIDAAGIATLLGDFDVKGDTFHVSEELQRKLYKTIVRKKMKSKGYTLEDLKPLFDKYLSDEPEVTEVSDPAPFNGG